MPAPRVILAGLLLPVALGACGERHQTDIPAPAAPGIVRDDFYHNIRGIVTSLPVEGRPGTELRIHHEHIPDFRTKDGPVNISADGVPGMKSMVMPFPVAKDLDISGLSVGDKIAFDFVVHWGGSPAWEITRFEPLDPDAVIDFTNRPVADPESAGDEQP